MQHLDYATVLKTIDGRDTTLAEWRGKVLLVVNVASQCGLTPQYEGLQQLYQSHKDKGLVVLGFPCNQFLGQEPGTEQEIQNYCTTTWDVTFPLFAKTEVNGPGRHPLYRQLVAAAPQAQAAPGSEFYQRMVSKGRAPKEPGDILWNFEKFLVNGEGQVLGRFAPDMTPDNPLLVSAIDRALA
ncbi:thioredoxin/glutathione peroxidase BtuE [Salmonella enterica subsp. enterica serovar Choleraesuis]|nr:thioredoxin/glutathione peroxidase BtuE [Salmonella enterica subsp. enterica serovar Choleraesuis]